jgi:dihydrofolate reductase
MRRLIFQEYVTLDGYAAGPDDSLDFFATLTDQDSEDNLALFESVDTMLLGATTYRQFAEVWPTATHPLAPRLNALRKVVVSSTLSGAPWGDWEPGEIVTDGVAGVAALKAEKGKGIVLWGSISLFHTLLTAGLVDEVQLVVCPTVLGAGKRVFPTGQFSMELIDSRPWATNGVLLRYRPLAS